jgi:CDP-diacylglycerol--glycerol-3-phosphate 3-phosphatidyltransferase
MVRQIPNILTLTRLVLGVVFVSMLLYSRGASVNRVLVLDLSFVVFLLAGLTDIIDGEIARRFGLTSRLGRMLDPFVDKVVICGAFICFAVIGMPQLFDWSSVTLRMLLWTVAVIITAREVFVTILRHIAEAKGINFAASWAGKIKMFVQSFAIGTVLVKTAHVQNAIWGHWFTAMLLGMVVAVTVISAWSAIKRSRLI